MSEHIVPVDECPLTHLQVDEVTWRCLTPEQRALLQEADETLALVQDPEAIGEEIVEALVKCDELYHAIRCKVIRLQAAMTLRDLGDPS